MRIQLLWSLPWQRQPGAATGAADTAASARRGGLHEFFRYHGVFAPGVRLMRALSVKGKALLVGMTFLLPVLVLLYEVQRNLPAQASHFSWLPATVAGCLALAVYVLLSFYRVIDGGLLQLKGQVGRMASGDLSARPAPWGRDEVAQAMHSLGESLARLADLFAVVRQGVAAASHASREIAGGNQDLARRTSVSAQSIEQILQGVGRYIEQLDACGNRVDLAEGVVQRMRLDAAHARHQMQQLDERMQSLQKRGREIGEIVELIDNLAFRTNILALNASIEAAKAGDAGRGFAVVAQEVRSLAKRSAESARRISDIIGRSTDDISHGHALAGEAVSALHTTDEQVNRIHAEMQQVVSLTRAGQQNSQDILAELRGLSTVTQENRRLVEQMASASNALSDQGLTLDDKVASFKLT